MCVIFASYEFVLNTMSFWWHAHSTYSVYNNYVNKHVLVKYMCYNESFLI